jgi:hypothetical protein
MPKHSENSEVSQFQTFNIFGGVTSQRFAGNNVNLSDNIDIDLPNLEPAPDSRRR